MTTEDDKKRDQHTEPGSDTETHGDTQREQAGTEGPNGTDTAAGQQPTPSGESAAASEAEDAPASEPRPGGEGPGSPRPPGDDETRRGGRPIAVAALVIALLVAVGVGLGGYELWQKLRQLRGAQQGMVSSQALEQRSQALSQRIDTLASRNEKLEQRLSGVQDTVSQLAGRLDQRAQQAGALADQFETLRQQQRSLAGRVDEAITVAGSEGDDWRRAEAGYLASVAVYRVRFHGDVAGALRALRTADELLAAADAPPAALREALSAARERLSEVTLPDREALASRIEDLEAGISQWPLQSGVESVAARARDGSPAAPDPAQAPGWRQALTRAWEQVKASLGQLVVVQRDGKSLPLVSPAERFFLEQNLRLRLESARLALLAGDEALYRRSLERVQSWLERYFDTSVPDVRNAVSEASSLAAASITPQLPDLSSTLEPLTRLD